MTAETLALFPAVAAAISIVNGVYAFKRRHFGGALYFFLMPLGTAIWSIGYSAELLASPDAMIAIDNLEFIGSDLVVIGFFLFAWHYTRESRPPHWLLLYVVFNQVFAWTDSGLLRVQPAVKEMAGAYFLTYDYGPWMWVNIAVYYSLLFSGAWLLIRKLPRTHGIFRRQTVILLLSSMIPWALSTLTVFGLLPIAIPNLDISPLFLTAGNLLLTAALFWSGALTIAPLAREQTFELMEDGVIVVSQGSIIDFNRSATRLLPDALAIGGPLPPVLAEETREFESRPGVWLQVRKATLTAAGSQGTIYTLHDITEDRQVLHALQSATAHAVRASLAKSTFLANMSHEIRTPLTAILGIAEILQDSALNSEQRDMVQSFQKAGESLLTTINDLLDLSRIEAGKMPLAPRDFSVHELLGSVCQLFRMKISSARQPVELTLTLDPDLPEHLCADDFRINQIVTNLLGNAVKFTAAGRIHVRAGFARGVLEISVEDTGPGIPGNRIEAVFGAFEQADASATRAFGGSGLGLAIVQELVRLLGGTVVVTSQPGTGSRFTVRLPADPASAAVQKSAAAPGAIELHGEGLLVAEDTEVIRAILARHLQTLGVPATFVENGAEAVDRFRRGRFDAVLLDIQMPVMDGFEAARSIRDLEKTDLRMRTPLIAISASAMPEDVLKARQSGFDLHIAKPISRLQLHQALHEALCQTDLRSGI